MKPNRVRCTICGEYTTPNDKTVEGKMKKGGFVRIHLRCWAEEQKERRTKDDRRTD